MITPSTIAWQEVGVQRLGGDLRHDPVRINSLVYFDYDSDVSFPDSVYFQSINGRSLFPKAYYCKVERGPNSTLAGFSAQITLMMKGSGISACGQVGLSSSPPEQTKSVWYTPAP